MSTKQKKITIEELLISKYIIFESKDNIAKIYNNCINFAYL